MVAGQVDDRLFAHAIRYSAKRGLRLKQLA
jgi:hypothetical protein